MAYYTSCMYIYDGRSIDFSFLSIEWSGAKLLEALYIGAWYIIDIVALYGFWFWWWCGVVNMYRNTIYYLLDIFIHKIIVYVWFVCKHAFNIYFPRVSLNCIPTHLAQVCARVRIELIAPVGTHFLTIFRPFNVQKTVCVVGV